MKFPTLLARHGWQPAAWLRVTGSDAATFLQGQLTNDLRDLSEGGAVYGLWLTVKGKVLADSFVLRGSVPDEFWVGSYFSPAGVIRERLERYIIADDVSIEDATSAWAGLTLLGEGATAALAPGGRAGFVFSGRRGSGECREWVFPAATGAEAQREFASLPELTAEEIRRCRLAAGIAAVPADVGPGDLPNEGGLDRVAISYTKGCYLGQEVIARLKSMGQVRRQLRRVAGTGETLPAPGGALYRGARQVGELRSVARDGAGGWLGLAMLSRLHVEPDVPLALAPDAAPAVRVLGPP